MSILETKRLYLRELTQADKPELMKVLCNPTSMQYYPHVFSEKEAERWIEWNIENYAKYGHGLWAVVLKENGVFIGDCGITMQDISGEIVPEIGFHIIPEYCRKGYATEAATACRDYAFNTLNYPRIFSYTIDRNIPSLGVAKKLGLKFYKTFEKYGETEVVHYAEKQ